MKEFKAFAMKGNVLDLAVAVIIGGAFGKIVSSLVADIITPVIGLFMGGVNFTGLKYTLHDATVMYGVFVQSVIDFLIVALVIFIIIKAINKAKRKFDAEKQDDPVPPPPSEEVLLLREIRDSLKK